MLKNYLITAIRNITRRRLNAFVVMAGLVVSFTFCLLMFLYVDGALRWDKEHPESDRLYLMGRDIFSKDDVPAEYNLLDFSEKAVTRSGFVSYVHAMDFRENLPEMASSVLVFDVSHRSKTDVRVGDKVFNESLLSAEENFFDFFAHEVISGNVAQAQADPKSLVISQDMAAKFFGEASAIGQTVKLFFRKEQKEFRIGAVVKFPGKSSIKFDMLSNLEANPNISKNLYELQSNSAFRFFVSVPEQADIASLEQKLQNRFTTAFSEHLASQRNFYPELSPESPFIEMNFVKVKDIHLEPLLAWPGKANVQHIVLVALFALVLLIVSGVNYFLITMATLSGRVTEISIRRVTGAGKKHVLVQFWIENSLMVIVSLMMAVCVLQLSLPFIEEKTGAQLIYSIPFLLKAAAVTGIGLLLLSFPVSLYPSQVITRFSLSGSLKGNRTFKVNTRFVNWLVAIQFVLCFVFIASGLIMNRQVNYLLNKSMGFDQEQVVYLYANDQAFIQAVKASPEFEDVARGGAWLFGHGRMGFQQKVNGETMNLMQLDAEKGIFDVLGLQVDWLEENYGEGRVAVVNGALADLIGRENLATTTVGFNQRIVGVIEGARLTPFTSDDGDYYFINPNSEDFRLAQTFVKIKEGQLLNGMERLEQIWTENFPNKHFEYQFIDDVLAENYESYTITANLISFIALLGVVIACLGLFALNGIITHNRMKEIGIRKVLGASMQQIMILVNHRIFLIILTAALISIPLTSWLTSEWLKNFTDQVAVSWSYFALTAIIGLFMSMLVVSGHTIKAAFINPVDLIKDE